MQLASEMISNLGLYDRMYMRMGLYILEYLCHFEVAWSVYAGPDCHG